MQRGGVRTREGTGSEDPANSISQAQSALFAAPPLIRAGLPPWQSVPFRQKLAAV